MEYKLYLVLLLISLLLLSNNGGMVRTLSEVNIKKGFIILTVMATGVNLIQGDNNHTTFVYNNLHDLDDTLGHHTANMSDHYTSAEEDNFMEKYVKCRCEGNQAWNGSVCVDIQTKVAVMDPDTGEINVYLTDEFEGVTVRNIQCPRDHLKVNLVPNGSSTNQFTLLPQGTLSWHQQRYEHYCIEHTLAGENGSLSWEAHLCLPPPTIPCCCHDNSTLCQNGFLSCTGNGSTHQFTPSIMLYESLTKWPQVRPVAGRKCKQNEAVLNFTLNTGEAHLSYESGEVSIVWTTSYHIKESQKEGFCVSPEKGGGAGGYTATICQQDHKVIYQDVCANVTCVRKCCPKGKIHYGLDCVDAESETELWEPHFVNEQLMPVTPPQDLTFLYGRPQCSMYLADPSGNKDDTFHLLVNGSLLSPAIDELDPPTHYCLDNFKSHANNNKKITTKALLCFSEVKVEPVCVTAKETVYPTLLVISAAFLGLTLLIYLSVPDLRDKLHGRCLISLTSAFFVAYVLMSISYLSSTDFSSSICTCLGFFKHLSLLAAFFWLNVMCFDIWRTLRKTRTVSGGRRSLHRFLWYSLYAWGSALVIAVVAVVLDHLPPSSTIIRPNFNNMFCWFSESKSLWVYFYAWVSLVLVTNMVFFVLVIVILVKGQKNSMLRRSREMNRERMWLYVKLFLVMGATWIAEVVSYQHGKCVEWMFMDIINSLEGVTLFLVFILNRTTLNKIKARWKCCASRSLTSPSSRTFSSSLTSDSKKQDSVLSRSSKNSSIVSRIYSNASSTSAAVEMEAITPMNTLKETGDETSYHEATEEGELSRPLTIEAGGEQPT